MRWHTSEAENELSKMKQKNIILDIWPILLLNFPFILDVLWSFGGYHKRCIDRQKFGVAVKTRAKQNYQ